MVKNPPAKARDSRDVGLIPGLGREDPLEKEMATHSIFLPGKSHGQRSLMGYGPWDHKELDTTEQLNTHTHCRSISGSTKLSLVLCTSAFQLKN